MEKNESPYISFRLSVGDYENLVRLAADRQCSRSEAMRLVFQVGLPIATAGFKPNHGRIAELLEYIGVTMGVVIKRDHPDYEELIEQESRARMEEYHA